MHEVVGVLLPIRREVGAQAADAQHEGAQAGPQAPRRRFLECLKPVLELAQYAGGALAARRVRHAQHVGHKWAGGCQALQGRGGVAAGRREERRCRGVSFWCTGRAHRRSGVLPKHGYVRGGRPRGGEQHTQAAGGGGSHARTCSRRWASQREGDTCRCLLCARPSHLQQPGTGVAAERHRGESETASRESSTAQKAGVTVRHRAARRFFGSPTTHPLRQLALVAR